MIFSNGDLCTEVAPNWSYISTYQYGDDKTAEGVKVLEDR